ncbi:hypothetical protein V8C35DRAFT_329711 [Trichoderma chlorosporum]
MQPMDPSHLDPHFHALDIILGYLNRGNSAPEIRHISSVAEAWCQHYHNHLLEHTPASLDEVLWAHPFLFDLSIRSFARLYSFHGHRGMNNFTQNTRLSQANNFLSSPLSHTRPHIAAQQFFSAMIDAYTLHVGGNGRWFHDRIVAQDLKTSPIIYYIPEVIHRIAALNVCELLTREFSTFSPKTSLGFSCCLERAVDIVMMDAPPGNAVEDVAFTELMDIDGDGDVIQVAPRPQNVTTNKTTRASARSSKRKSAPKGIKRDRANHSRRKQHKGGIKKRKKRH